MIADLDTEHERGANLVEYIVLLSMIALAVVAAVVFLRGQVSGKFGDAGTQLSNNGVAIAVCGAWVERDALDPRVIRGLNPCAPGTTAAPSTVTSPPTTAPTPPTTVRRHDDD